MPESIIAIWGVLASVGMFGAVISVIRDYNRSH